MKALSAFIHGVGVCLVALVVGVTVYRILISGILVQSQTTSSKPTTDNSVNIITKQPPTGIHIARLSKTWPIQAANVQDNTWDMFDDAVAWLSTSAIPGEGNVILYAHNRESLWKNLYKLTIGDIVEVDSNGKKYSYTVVRSKAVKSNDVSSVLSTENQLTMYTCEGSFDVKRRVVYAELIVPSSQNK